jgi:hypothetical protein
MLIQFGTALTKQLWTKYPHSKSIFKFLLMHSINKYYKFPPQSFMAFDFTGCGYVKAENIYTNNHIYRLPFTKDEIKNYLENESLFAK